MDPARKRPRAQLIVVLALSASACGSTVANVGATSRSPLTSGALGVSTANPATSSDAGDLTGTHSQSTSSSGSLTVSAGTGDSSTVGISSVPGATSAAPFAIGITATTVSVGIPYINDQDKANAAVGASGITTGNVRADFQAAIDGVNERGGVAGRKLIGVFLGQSATSGKTVAQLEQEQCAYFTQDHKVFAVYNYAGAVISTCMERAGGVVLDSGTIIYADKATLAQFPHYFVTSAPSQDRMMADLVTVLNRNHYFDGWDAATGSALATSKAHVGVLTLDDPNWNRPLASKLLPGLARIGHPVAKNDIVVITAPKSYGDGGALTAAIAASVIKFRGNGVTHVILLDTGGQGLGFFAPAANSQGYRPRLGLTSGSAIQTIYDSGLASNSSLAGAVGLSWLPTIDVPAAKARKLETAKATACIKLLKAKTGQTYNSANEYGIALIACGFIDLLAHGLSLAKLPTRDSFSTAIEGFGASYSAVITGTTFFGPRHHDGLTQGFDEIWDTRCKCTQYVGSHLIP